MDSLFHDLRLGLLKVQCASLEVLGLALTEAVKFCPEFQNILFCPTEEMYSLKAEFCLVNQREDSVTTENPAT